MKSLFQMSPSSHLSINDFFSDRSFLASKLSRFLLLGVFLHKAQLSKQKKYIHCVLHLHIIESSLQLLLNIKTKIIFMFINYLKAQAKPLYTNTNGSWMNYFLYFKMRIFSFFTSGLNISIYIVFWFPQTYSKWISSRRAQFTVISNIIFKIHVLVNAVCPFHIRGIIQI